ncbi:hypothetical protein ABI59_19880 [Acidobacteria bacterium Mor1]|nr:hypothetical protein ABI59_19880 [Acidobacteria bacterium Mor1]
MRSMLLLLFGVCLCGCSEGASGPGDAAELDRILELHAEARGGKLAIESIRALRLEVEIEEPTFSVHGTYVATRDGYMRVDIYDGDSLVFVEALGPAGGWQWNAGGDVRPLSSEGEAALRRGLLGNLYGLHEWPAHDVSLTLVPAQSGPATDYWVVDAVEASGFTRRLRIDKQSHLVVRSSEVSALHPDMDATPIAQYTERGDWELHRGVLLPRFTRRVDRATGETVQTARARRIELLSAAETAPGWARPAYFEPRKPTPAAP